MMIRFLSEAIILAIHDDQIRLYGGKYGVRDASALDSALHMPQAQFSGQFDGNKRTAGMAMFTFLQLNDLEPAATEIDYYQAMMAVASGSMSKEQLTDWLQTATHGIPPEIA